VKTAASLPTPKECAEAVKAFLASGCERIGLGLEDFRVVGGFLIDAKTQVAHGEWERWVTRETPLSPRQARRYMQFHRATRGLPYGDVKRLQPAWDKTEGRSREPSTHASSPADEGDDADSESQGAEETGDTDSAKAKTVSQDRFEDDETEDCDSPGKSDSVSDLNEPQQVKAKRTGQLVDGDKRPVPPHLEDVFRQAKAFREWATRLSSIKREVTTTRKQVPDLFKQFREQPFNAGLKQAVDQLNLSAPFIVCSYCGGLDSENCTGCKGSGFLSKAQARCVPKELR